MTRIEQRPSTVTVTTLTCTGVAIGVVICILTRDVIEGVMAGALFIAISVGMVRLWFGGGTQRPHHT
jgi:hypothetical protein